MSIGYRFGRRIPLPSTAQIRHELIVFTGQEEARKKCALADGLPDYASWDDIGEHRAEVEKKLAASRP